MMKRKTYRTNKKEKYILKKRNKQKETFDEKTNYNNGRKGKE
jgi:hypothetical protein